MRPDEEIEIELLLDIKAIAIGLLGLVMALLSWIGNRHIRRLDELEKSAATKEEFRKAFDDLISERRANHVENSQKLDRLLEKIDANEVRASNSRHELNNSVNELAVKVALGSRQRPNHES